MSLKIIHLELSELNDLVEKWHRHHKRIPRHRFSIGAIDTETGELVGGCSVGKPVARNGANPKEVIEVTRLVTNGHKNACSFLYGAAARVGKLLGYKKIQTYILQTESGHSLIAAGWVEENGECGGGIWRQREDGVKRREPSEQIQERKRLWVKYL